MYSPSLPFLLFLPSPLPLTRHSPLFHSFKHFPTFFFSSLLLPLALLDRLLQVAHVLLYPLHGRLQRVYLLRQQLVRHAVVLEHVVVHGAARQRRAEQEAEQPRWKEVKNHQEEKKKRGKKEKDNLPCSGSPVYFGKRKK